MPAPAVVLRNEPVQARSTQRLESLLDSAAAAIDAVGFERLTTAMVAEGAGASIGTVYRYFPDRISVLQAVAARAVSRFQERVQATIAEGDFSSWWDFINAVIDDAVTAFQSEPAFASLRFGDMLDLRPRENSHTGSSEVASVLSSYLSSRFGLNNDANLAFHLEVGFNLCDSLLHRAFMYDAQGDKRFITEARSAVRNYLERVL